MSKLKTVFTVLYFFGGVGLFAQTQDSTKAPVIIDLGIKNDTVTFQGLRAVNPLEVKVYRQIVRSQFRSVDGKLEQQPLDMYFEERTRRTQFTRLNKVTAEDFIWSKRI